jgi:hypothetical protein
MLCLCPIVVPYPVLAIDEMELYFPWMCNNLYEQELLGIYIYSLDVYY